MLVIELNVRKLPKNLPYTGGVYTHFIIGLYVCMSCTYICKSRCNTKEIVIVDVIYAYKTSIYTVFT